MYYAADVFEVVFAVSDLHGDVELTMTLFGDVMRVVAWDRGSWRWVADPVTTCVVVCGDVVDRYRSGGTYPEKGENVLQTEQPDDLFLLRLLNQWSRLAAAAGGAVIRLIGNHEAFAYPTYASHRSKQLLYDRTERHHAAGGDLDHNHRLSFTTPGAAYWDAIWSDGVVALWVQIGGWLFVHAGLTPAAVRALHPHDRAFRTLREWVSERSPHRSLPIGIRDALETRTLNTSNGLAGTHTRMLLNDWSRHSGHPTAVLVVGHCVQSMEAFFPTVGHSLCHAHRIHRALADRTTWWHSIDTWEHLEYCTGTTNQSQSRITAAVDANGELSLVRIDVGVSRAWCTWNPQWVCWPHALCIHPKTNKFFTMATDRPLPM
jgi:hypothetical protein